MQYQEYEPNRLLSPYIETYWIGGSFEGEGKYHKILPDGCVDIIFSFDTAKSTCFTKIVGTMTSFFEISYPPTVEMFGIRFRPAGITAFTRVPVEEFTDRDVEMSLVDTLLDKSFYDKLHERPSVEEMIRLTDRYLIDCIPSLYKSDKQIISAVELIYFAKGQMSPQKLAYEVCWCQRQFERKFKSVIGVSPKTFSKIHRFKNALQYLRKNPGKDLTSVAIECGYYDHAHLIKDFKTLSGNTPTALR